MTTRFSLAELLTMEFPEAKDKRRKKVLAAERPEENQDVTKGLALVAAAAETVLASAVSEAPRQMLAIAVIRLDGDTQPRGGLNEERVTEYRQNLEEGEELPSVDVVFDGTDYWLWDGFHRVESSKRQGRTEIAVKLTRGTLSDAQWLSYSANKKHGLNRSGEDKARAVQRALRHPKGVLCSNREIARHCGVDEKTVRNYREKMEAVAEIPQQNKRIGVDGKTYNRESHVGVGGGRKKSVAENPQLKSGSGGGGQRPSRYVLPTHLQARLDEAAAARSAQPPSPANPSNPPTSPTPEPLPDPIPVGEMRSAFGGGPLGAPEYAPVFMLEERVRMALRAWKATAGYVMTDPGLAGDLRTLAVDPTWEWTELGKVMIAQLEKIEFRDEDLMTALGNVADRLERNEQQTTAAFGAAPAEPQFKQETLTKEQARPLTHQERQGLIGVELVYWQEVLMHLPLVGELTGKHSAIHTLRREVEKVIAIYAQERGG